MSKPIRLIQKTIKPYSWRLKNLLADVFNLSLLKTFYTGIHKPLVGD